MIPDEAVEAAAGELVEMRRVGEHSSYEYARAALKAAAPHLMAQGWDEGYEAKDSEYPFGPRFTNPYRKATP